MVSQDSTLRVYGIVRRVLLIPNTTANHLHNYTLNTHGGVSRVYETPYRISALLELAVTDTRQGYP